MRVPGDPSATRYLDKSFACLETEPIFAQARVELLTQDASPQGRQPSLGIAVGAERWIRMTALPALGAGPV